MASTEKTKEKPTLLHEAIQTQRALKFSSNGITTITPEQLTDFQVEVAKVLINNGADIQAIYKRKTVLDSLIEALVHSEETGVPYEKYSNRFELVELLIEKGADLNRPMTGYFDKSPIYYAVINGAMRTLRFLVKNGADVNVRSHFQNTPLHYAQYKPEMTHFLIDNGADVNAKNQAGETPLHRAAYSYRKETIKSMIALLDAGADINARTKYGETALHMAVGSLDMKKIRFLIHAGANINAQNKSGKTALYRLASRYAYNDDQKGKKETQKILAVLNLLIENGADIHIKNKFGKSPIQISVERHKPEFTEILARNGANVNQKIMN